MHKYFFFSLFFLVFSTACRHDPLSVDIRHTTVSIQFMNMDSLLYHTPEQDLISLRSNLSNTISELFDYQIGYCMRIGRVQDTAFVNSLLQYRSDKDIQRLETEIADRFSDLSTEKDNLIVAFRYLRTHLPQVAVPTYIVFQNSLFTSSAFCTEKEIGIGLDQYLGFESPSVRALPAEPFHDWIKKGFDHDYLERDAILSWILTHVLDETQGNLAEQIIYYGKALYLTEACFPKSPKNIIIRYSKDDFNWAKDNEYSFWKYLIDENMLFKTNERNAQNILSEGPFTAGLPQKGPDRLGQYLGWQIVRQYMEKSKISFQDLINTPYNKILQTYSVDH